MAFCDPRLEEKNFVGPPEQKMWLKKILPIQILREYISRRIGWWIQMEIKQEGKKPTEVENVEGTLQWQ